MCRPRVNLLLNVLRIMGLTWPYLNTPQHGFKEGSMEVQHKNLFPLLFINHMPLQQPITPASLHGGHPSKHDAWSNLLNPQDLMSLVHSR